MPELLTSEIVTQTVIRLQDGVLPILNHRDSWKVIPEVVVAMERLMAIVDLVRSPSGGWPGEREATPENLLPYVMDEAMDILEAMEHSWIQTGLPVSHPLASLQKLLHDRLILSDAIAHFLWGIARSSVDTMQLLGGLAAECFQAGQDWTPGILRLMAILTIQTPTTQWVLDLVTAEPPLPELHRDTFLRWSGSPVFWGEAFLQSLERSIYEGTPLLQGLLDRPIPSDIIVPGQPWQKGTLSLHLSFTFVPHALKPSLSLRNPSLVFSPINASSLSQWEEYRFTLSPNPSSQSDQSLGEETDFADFDFVSSDPEGSEPEHSESNSELEHSELKDSELEHSQPEHSEPEHSEPEHLQPEHSALEYSESKHLQPEHSALEHSESKHLQPEHSALEHSESKHLQPKHSELEHSESKHLQPKHSALEHSESKHLQPEHSELEHSEPEKEFIELDSFAALFQDLPSAISSPDRLVLATEAEGLGENGTIAPPRPVEAAMPPIPEVFGEPDQSDREDDLFGAWGIETKKEESTPEGLEGLEDSSPNFEILLVEDLKDTIVTVIPETFGQPMGSDRFESWNLEQWKIRWTPSEERSSGTIAPDPLRLPKRYYVQHLLQSFSQTGEVTRPEPDKQQRLIHLVNLACQALTPPDPPPTLLNTHFVLGESTVAELIQRLTWFLIRDSYGLTCLLSGINAQILQPEWGWESGVLRLLPILQLQTHSTAGEEIDQQGIPEQSSSLISPAIDSPAIDLQIDLSTGSPAPLETLLVLPDILINIEGTDWPDTRAPVFQFRTELLSRLQQLLPELEVLRSPVLVELAPPNQPWQAATLQIQFELGFQA